MELPKTFAKQTPITNLKMHLFQENQPDFELSEYLACETTGLQWNSGKKVQIGPPLCNWEKQIQMDIATASKVDFIQLLHLLEEYKYLLK